MDRGGSSAAKIRNRGVGGGRMVGEFLFTVPFYSIRGRGWRKKKGWREDGWKKARADDAA